MRLALIAVGKLRDAWVREGCDVYLTRLRPRLRTEVIEVKDGADLLRAVPPRFRVWALDEHGVEVTSVELSVELARLDPVVHRSAADPQALCDRRLA